MRKFALIALLTTIASWANAQRTSLPVAHHHPIHNSAFFLADPFYSDALNREGPFPASQPTVIVLQAAPAPVPDPPSKPNQPLMIELQGGRYVRVSGEESSGVEMKLIDSAALSRALASDRSQKPQAEMRSAAAPNPAPAVLVFRDGHHEDVSEYTIADGNLYNPHRLLHERIVEQEDRPLIAESSRHHHRQSIPRHKIPAPVGAQRSNSPPVNS